MSDRLAHLIARTALESATARRLVFQLLVRPIYVGKIVWNRGRKVRDPDTGRRTMRVRPQSDWVWVDERLS